MTDVLEAVTPNPLLSRDLMERMDGVIRAIPEHQLGSPDHDMPGMDQRVSRDPFSHFGRLRDDVGDVVQYADGHFGDVKVYNCFGRDLSKPNFAVIGYNAIRSMVMDKTNFVNAGAYGAQGDAQQPGFTFVNELDGAEHRAMRRLFEMEVFSKQYLVDLADSTVGPIADFLAQRVAGMMARGETVDLRRDLALPLLYMAMARIIGIDMADLSYFVDLGEKAFGGPRDFAAAEAASAELDAYFTRVYEERLAAGDLDKSDVMSVMRTAQRDGLSFSPREVIVYCRFLLPAGIETTWRQTANICHALMKHPEQYQQVVADRSLWPAAIEEGLRWMPSGFVLPRSAAADTVLAGVEIPAGSSMYGVFGVANRDPRIWPDPDRFDIHREKKPHLTFSMGTHTCMGQQLARQSFNNLMRALTTHLPHMVLDGDPADLGSTGYIIRCTDAVHVKAG